MKKRIAIFASGAGTNAQNIIRYFKTSSVGEVVLVLSNKRHAKVLEKAENEDIKSLFFDKVDLYETGRVLDILESNEVDLIVLAGFLLKFPDHILHEYPNRVINLHPALLPKYGGKGMYGKYVHEAIIANGEKESGITIHYVNEHYDEGTIIFQASTAVSSEDNPDSLAEKIHELEYKHFPKVIETLLETE
ncbi:phosphoribosylglycinamide formyltransferase [Aureitalea sp. L0-47]|uniref:phosphoribosylglycinamide formyltransferase n=1 Tax=Aureitalea sp. L0-47 TaxID=2816962 RepID=UPI002237B3A0|nr:phosphoribosylglycinamide formyltransferase [Aureitalea sp. L0-47]MCW5520931.1 phosphoribosylglycinamide formyltransferase [Aureitalea sp. L0-47]